MKRNIFKSVGLFTLVMASFALVSCEEVLEQILEIRIDKWADLVNEKEHETIIEGNTLTYGSHSYSVEGDLDELQVIWYDVMVTFFDNHLVYYIDELDVAILDSEEQLKYGLDGDSILSSLSK